MYDIEHLILISDITGLTAKGAVIEIEFKRSDETLSKFTLRLRNSAGFLHALRNKLTPEIETIIHTFDLPDSTTVEDCKKKSEDGK